MSVNTVNLTGQLKNVTMRKIEEPGDVVAIYYIGDTTVANREVLVFDISVTPEGVEHCFPESVSNGSSTATSCFCRYLQLALK